MLDDAPLLSKEDQLGRGSLPRTASARECRWGRRKLSGKRLISAWFRKRRAIWSGELRSSNRSLIR